MLVKIIGRCGPKEGRCWKESMSFPSTGVVFKEAGLFCRRDKNGRILPCSTAIVRTAKLPKKKKIYHYEKINTMTSVRVCVF